MTLKSQKVVIFWNGGSIRIELRKINIDEVMGKMPLKPLVCVNCKWHLFGRMEWYGRKSFLSLERV